jgi:hypothetical protein
VSESLATASPRPVPLVDRRSLLAAFPLLAAGLAGCEVDEESAAVPAAGAAATAAVRVEWGLLAAYDRAIADHPGLADTLRAVRSHHVEHIRALSAAAAVPATRISPTATAGTPSTTARTGGPAATLAELARLERAAAQTHRAGSLTSAGALATLLASVHAAETMHVDLLGRFAGTTPE